MGGATDAYSSQQDAGHGILVTYYGEELAVFVGGLGEGHCWQTEGREKTMVLEIA